MSERPLNKSKSGKAGRSKPFQPRSLKIEEWSPVDQLAWREAVCPAVRLQRGGAAAHLAPVSQKDIANRYGLYLDFLQRNGLFDRTSGAADFVVPDYVQQFVVELENRVSSVTIWNSIYKLRRAAECLAPDVNLSWLLEIENDLALLAEPKDKTDRLVLAERLLEAGLTLIAEAERFAATPMRRAQGVRNGLMIALLALHPLRIKNFATLRIGQSIQKIGGHWWLIIEFKQTKTRRRDERRVPEFLTEIIDRYVEKYRPILLKKNVNGSAFWISSTRGAQLTVKNMGTLISKITEQTLGVDVSPHLFRMAAATTAAVYGASTPHLASGVLGHRDERITEEHYNRACSLHASAILSEIIEMCKSNGSVPRSS
jgi:site-specific recombinase XerD